MFKEWLMKLLLKILADFLAQGEKPVKLSADQKAKLKACVDRHA